MGGVGMLCGDDLALPYPWIMRNSITIRGQWMCPREANVRFINLVRSGLLDLSQFEVTESISTTPTTPSPTRQPTAARSGRPSSGREREAAWRRW